jgi:hypothetical protein
LSIAITETLQALLNQKSKGCLKKHSLSLESQRSQIATHNPKKVGCSSLDTLSLLTKHPIALPIQGVSMGIFTSLAEIIYDISNLGELRIRQSKAAMVMRCFKDPDPFFKFLKFYGSTLG